MTPIPAPEKSAFLALVQVAPYPGGLQTAANLEITLNSYEDLPAALNGQLLLYADNPGYLAQSLAVFDDTELQNVGIYNNKTANTPLENPVMIVNSTYTGGIHITADQEMLMILSGSSVDTITISEGIYLEWLYISTSTVKLLDASAYNVSTLVYAKVGYLYIPYSKNTPAALLGATDNSHIGDTTGVEQGSYFGGILDYTPGETCNAPVTDLAAAMVTHDSATITWTLPGNPYLFIKPYYRQTGTVEWIEGTSANGYFMQSAGFVFNTLKADTYYDFMVRVKCPNGGIVDSQISAKTPCCGSGQMSLWKQCPITILIKTSPDPAQTQTLCNGITIAKEYPVGATITIPYLASSNAVPLEPFVIDNLNYQNFPYAPGTGTFDASTTTIGAFIDGNVITVNVSVPA